MKISILVIACVMYLLVIIFQEKKVLFTSIAAGLIILLSLTLFPSLFLTSTKDLSVVKRVFCTLFYALTSLVNWNVLFIYIGSMAIASLFIYSKMPVRISDIIIDKSINTRLAIVLLLAITGIISIFVENVATVLLMAPIALSLSKRLKISPVPFLIGLSVMSNLEGTATLVGDPPSMIFASFAGFSFNDFFIYEGKLSIFFFIQAGLLAGCVYFFFKFRGVKEKVRVSRTPIVSIVPSVLLIAMILGLACLSFLHITFAFASGLYVLSLGIIGLLWYAYNTRKKDSMEERGMGAVKKLVAELDWETIFFLIGIFIVVGALTASGLLEDLSRILSALISGNKVAGFLLIVAVSILISGFIDNVPYIIVMLPVAASLASSIEVSRELYMFALLIGSCLGGNLTPFGASANVVTMGMLKKEGYKLGFVDWIKIGLPFTLITTLTAALTLYLTYGL